MYPPNVTVMVAPTEPEILREDAVGSNFSEKFGADIYMAGPTGLVTVIQRKTPTDFILSLHDGRLAQNLTKMKKFEYAFLLREGEFSFNKQGSFKTHYGKIAVEYSRKQLEAIEWSIRFQYGVEIIKTKDLTDTKRVLIGLARYMSKTVHYGLAGRKKVRVPRGENAQLLSDLHILQGFPGLGPTTAKRLIDEIGHIPLKWTISEDKFHKVTKNRGKKAWQYLS